MVFPEDIQDGARGSNEFGSFEKKVSASAIINDYTQGRNLSVNEVFRNFRNHNDVVTKQYIEKKFDYLAVGIANIITILHPEAVVLAGKITCQWDFISAELQPRINSLIYTSTRILRSSTGDFGAAMGAIIERL